MILDSQLTLSDAQALSATAASTNYIDFGLDRDIGKGEPLAIVITIDVAADGTTTDETYSIAVQTDDNTSFSSPATLTTYAPGYAALTLGSRHVLPLGYANERYLRINYTLGGTTPSVTLTAELQPMSMIDSNDYTYPNAYNIG